MGPESNITALEIREQSAEVRDKLPFLAQKVTARDDIEDTIRDLDTRISEQEAEIGKTEKSITEQETLNSEKHAELTSVEKSISEKNTTIKQKNEQVGDFSKDKKPRGTQKENPRKP